MKIDPRLLGELLRAQMMSNMTGTQSSNGTDNAASSSNMNSIMEFALMMQQMMESESNVIVNPTPEESQGRVASSLQGEIGEFPQRMMKASTFEPIVQRASEEHQVPTSLIRAVMQAESAFNPNAVSSSGAKGLMQLMDGTAAGLGVGDSFDPEQNIFGGTKYLANLLKKYNGNVAIAAAAYNAGPGRVDRLGIEDQQSLDANYERLPEETQTYVKRVLDNQLKWVEQER